MEYLITNQFFIGFCINFILIYIFCNIPLMTKGGWSSREIDFFNKNNYTFVKLSDTILRTSTASINASSILNQWRNDLKLRN